MLTIILVVLVLLGYHWLKDKIKCLLGFHALTMTSGIAVCTKCGKSPKEYQ